jgi:hypothetical protein
VCVFSVHNLCVSLSLFLMSIRMSIHVCLSLCDHRCCCCCRCCIGTHGQCAPLFALAPFFPRYTAQLPYVGLIRGGLTLSMPKAQIAAFADLIHMSKETSASGNSSPSAERSSIGGVPAPSSSASGAVAGSTGVSSSLPAAAAPLQ